MAHYSRRRFLHHSAVVGVAAAAQMHTLGRVAHAAGGGDYKAMVCILLGGGADSFNMLVPYDATRYAQYAAVRSDLALARADLLPLAYTGAQGETFALHPGLGPVQRCSIRAISLLSPTSAPWPNRQTRLRSRKARCGYRSVCFRMPIRSRSGKPRCRTAASPPAWQAASPTSLPALRPRHRFR